ncbi:SDR family NAD(P)-dependent oxidoreductase [bacterium]|nr:SDR family NAD(P)-dependent oxidoreductase [bacterium]
MHGMTPAGRARPRAVVTGASQGLGRAFAACLAERGYDLVLAALPGTGLPALAETLRSRGVRAAAVECDLAAEEGRAGLLAAAREGGAPLSLLVNNVGVGANGLFDRLPYEATKAALDINLGATLAITYGLVPSLAAAPGAQIITVASLAAFYPMPLFAVYSSSKAFLLNWSLALRHELASLGIGVTVLAPGGMYTSEEIRQKVRSQGLGGRLSTMEPGEVADFALRAAARGKAVAIPGAFNKFLWFAGSHAPKDFVAASILARWRRAMSRLPGTEGTCSRAS